ncbi:hypothetical protein [Streptomyces sp. NRRL F-5065]|uniref:hypothetical protein n=1 Tax=Streptomyces sp. NRRL F-5065 TaxID=1463855 RepID=UPI000B2EB9A2|nr:hypothetical protein [Streptomyces sp. NRRL F-5065]
MKPSDAITPVIVQPPCTGRATRLGDGFPGRTTPTLAASADGLSVGLRVKHRRAVRR